MPDWEWPLIGLGCAAGGVVGGIWLLHEYFIAPGEVVLDQYKAILEDIYRETKQFCEQNEIDGIMGLTANQEAILAAKQKSADYLRPQVEKIITDRGTQLWSWVETAIIGIIAALAAPSVIDKLAKLVRDWRAQRPESSTEIASQYGHGHMIFEIVSNELALTGKLNVASALYNFNIPQIYNNHTQQALTAQIVYYNNLLPTLIPGTIQWIVATQMLSYMNYEISSVTGIMPVLHTWWLPPLI